MPRPTGPGIYEEIYLPTAARQDALGLGKCSRKGCDRTRLLGKEHCRECSSRLNETRGEMPVVGGVGTLAAAELMLRKEQAKALLAYLDDESD